MEIFPYTTVQFNSTDTTIRKTLDAIRSQSIKNYTGINLYFEGKIRNEKIEGYFTPADETKSKSPNHFDPYSGLEIKGSYNLKKGLIHVYIMPSLLFKLFMLVPIVSFLSSIYFFSIGENDKLIIGSAIGAAALLACVIYFKVVSNKIKQFITESYNHSLQETKME